MQAAGAGRFSPQAVIRTASALAADLSALADAELATRSQALRAAADGRPDQAEGVALVSEAYRRAAGLTLTRAQLIAGLVASHGGVAELADGEGKSVAAGLAAYLAVLAGGPAHVAVLDERLARRDHDRVEPVLALLGVTVGLSTASLSYPRRRAAYAADLTYGSYLQLGQDYLHDVQAISVADRALRGLTFAVIDEVDTVLADQGRVLITTTGKSRPADAGQYAALAELAGQLEPQVHYRLGSQPPVVTLTVAGEEALAEAAGLTGPDDPERFALDRKLADAIAAVAWLTRDVDYAVRGRRLIPGDRMQSFGRLARGIAQAVEAKEGLALTPEETLTGAITVRDFYRKYRQLGGLSATAEVVADELRHLYQLAVTPVPGRAAPVRANLGERQYEAVPGKLAALTAEVADRHFRGQPVLVGASSDATINLVSQALAERGIGHEVLRDGDQSAGRVLTAAGRPSAVTVISVTAARGYGVPLGGDAPASASRDQVIAAGGLAVLGAERSLLARPDDWLAGLAGQRGEPGEVRFYQARDDALLSQLTGGGFIRALPRRYPVELSSASRIGRTMLKLLRDRQLAYEVQLWEFRRALFFYEQAAQAQRDQIRELWSAVADGDSLRDHVLAAGESAAGWPAAAVQSRYEQLEREFGRNGIDRLERRVIRSAIDREWPSYLVDLVRFNEIAGWAKVSSDRAALAQAGAQFATSIEASFAALLARLGRAVAVEVLGIEFAPVAPGEQPAELER